MRYIDSIDVNTRISELLDNLDANIRTIGNDVGWHQHLGARKIGIVASAIGLLMHKKLGTAFAKEENVIAGLANKQNQMVVGLIFLIPIMSLMSKQHVGHC